VLCGESGVRFIRWWRFEPHKAQSLALAVAMKPNFTQAVAFAAAAYVYSKPEVWNSGLALAFLPLVFYVVLSYLDGSELTPQASIP
jgi:hypothetical protein